MHKLVGESALELDSDDLDTKVFELRFTQTFLCEALFTQTGSLDIANRVLLLRRIIITFCEELLRVSTGPVRFGSLKHGFEAAPKKNRL